MGIAQHKTAVEEASGILQDAVKDLETALDHPELLGIKRRVIAAVNKGHQTLLGAAGIYSPNANMLEVNQISASFQPLESIGGVPLERLVNPVFAEDLDIADEEKELFLSKRDNLYDRFLTMEDEQIFKLLKEPHGPAILRSVAKRAGLPDFREREIDVEFLALVRKRIAAERNLDEVVAGAQGVNSLNATEEEDEEEDVENENSGAPSYDHLKDKPAAPAPPALPKGKAGPKGKAPAKDADEDTDGE